MYPTELLGWVHMPYRQRSGLLSIVWHALVSFVSELH